jgi:molybdate transport system substrate-binding protein
MFDYQKKSEIKAMGSFKVFVGALAVLFGCTTPLAAKEYRLYAAAGIKIPLIALSQTYQTESGHTIINDFDTAGAAEKKFLADPNASFLITTKPRVDKAIAANLLSNGQTIHLVDTAAGIASSQAIKPVVRNGDDLKAALLNANKIAFSDPARGATVGLHFVKVIRDLGIEQEVMAKAVVARDGIETMRLIQSKTVDIGITQKSEVVQADRTTLVGPFPKEFELVSQYVLWYKTIGDAGVDAFVKLLTSARAAGIFAQEGLLPVTSRQ